jgi:hypothetical protein
MPKNVKCHFEWMRNFVPDSEERTQIEHLQKQGAEGISRSPDKNKQAGGEKCTLQSFCKCSITYFPPHKTHFVFLTSVPKNHPVSLTVDDELLHKYVTDSDKIPV